MPTVGNTVRLRFRFLKASDGTPFTPTGTPTGTPTLRLLLNGTVVHNDEVTLSPEGSENQFYYDYLTTASGVVFARGKTTDVLAAGDGTTDSLTFWVDAVDTSDPLASTVPGVYVDGSAGAALGEIDEVLAYVRLIRPGRVTIINTFDPTTRVLTLYRGDTGKITFTNLQAGLLGATSVTLELREANNDDPAETQHILAGAVESDTSLSAVITDDFTVDLLEDANKYVYDMHCTLSNGDSSSPIQKSPVVVIHNVKRS